MEGLGRWDPLKVRMYDFIGTISLTRKLAIYSKSLKNVHSVATLILLMGIYSKEIIMATCEV